MENYIGRKVRLTPAYFGRYKQFPDVEYTVETTNGSNIWKVVSDSGIRAMPYSPSAHTPECYLIETTMTTKPAPFTIIGKPNLIKAITEELVELGYRLESSSQDASSGVVQADHTDIHTLSDYKGLTHVDRPQEDLKFQLPAQYVEALEYAKNALASTFWPENFKFKVGDYVIIPDWRKDTGVVGRIEKIEKAHRGYNRFYWSELWMNGENKASSFPTMANEAWEANTRIATSQEIQKAKTVPAITYKTGDIVYVVKNNSGSCNNAGDIGTVGTLYDDHCEVKVRGRSKHGNNHYFTDLRPATATEISAMNNYRTVTLFNGQVATIDTTHAEIDGRRISIAEVEALVKALDNLPTIRGYQVSLSEQVAMFAFGCQGPYTYNDLRNVVNASKPF